MKNPMRSNSITVTMTPRQAVAVIRALEHAGLTTVNPRAWGAHRRVMAGLFDAGWRYDGDSTETWQLADQPSIPDRAS